MLELEQAAALYLDLVISTDTYTFISLRYFASVSGGTWQWGFVLMLGIKYFEERLIFTQCCVLPRLWPLTYKSTRTEQNMHWKLTIENQLMKAILHNMHVNLKQSNFQQTLSLIHINSLFIFHESMLLSENPSSNFETYVETYVSLLDCQTAGK